METMTATDIWTNSLEDAVRKFGNDVKERMEA
jgi:hypothetical protein